MRFPRPPRLWGYEPDLGAKTLTVTLGSLRQKIEPEPGPRYLVTVRGFGYMLKTPVPVLQPTVRR